MTKKKQVFKIYFGVLNPNI